MAAVCLLPQRILVWSSKLQLQNCKFYNHSGKVCHAGSGLNGTNRNRFSTQKFEETYKTQSTDIEEGLKARRARNLSTQVYEQFGKMEQAMTQFNSTKTLLENFIEAWKNRNSLNYIFLFFQ